MTFHNLGVAGWMGIATATASFLASIALLKHMKTVQENPRVRLDDVTVYRNWKNSLKAAIGFVTFGVIILVTTAYTNNGHQKIVAENRINRQEITADLEAQDFVVLGVTVDEFDDQHWAELAGPIEGCTYKYDVVKNPSTGNYVIVLGSGGLYTSTSKVVFSSDGDNAYIPECPEELFPDEDK